MNIIRYYCDSEENQEFFLNKILHKSWYYIVCKDNYLTFDILESKILTLKNI